MSHRPPRLGLLLVVETTAVAAIAALWRHPHLMIRWDDVGAWLRTTPPEPAVMAVAFHALAIVTAWLAVTTVAYLLARCARLPRLARAIGVATLPHIRRVIDRTVLVTATATALTVAPAGLVAWGQEPAGVTPPGSESVAYVPAPAGFPPMPEASPSAPAATHVVAPGDNFWRIAETHVGENGDVGSYWRELIAANRERLRSGDPDLIFPGEVFVLPPVEGP